MSSLTCNDYTALAHPAATLARPDLYYTVGMDSPTDRTLAERARRGDAEAAADAYGELVRRYQTSVFNVCYRLMGERRAAEDMAQEAFIRAYQRLQTFDLARPFGPWMRRVAANLCLNHLQMTPPPTVSLEDERDKPTGAAGDDPEAALEQTQSVEAVRAALLTLPAHYRAAIELRHFHEMRYDEIAAALKIPVSDVKSHLFRARKLLAKKLLSVG
jgi:RNA polymerase sigma-70 factor (ECF subfamily)